MEEEHTNSVVSQATNSFGTPLSKVRYTFACHDISTSFWHVRSFQCTEGLSQYYRLSIDLVTDDVHTNTDDLLGASCELIIERPASGLGEVHHSIYGIIHRIDYLGVTSGGRLVIRVHAVPALYLLGQRINSRIWQEMTVPEILEELLTEALEPYGRTVLLNKIYDGDRIYKTRDYCVQYQESDLQFVCRLLEEEGIAFYFQQSVEEEHEILVLTDKNEDYPQVTTMDGSTTIEICTDETLAETFSVETIQSFDWYRTLTSTTVTRRDFDWEHPVEQRIFPADAPEDRGDEDADEKARIREVYVHNQRRRFVEDDVKDRVADQKAAILNKRKIGSGRSNVTGLSPGVVFEVVGHSHPEVDGKYVVIEVEHHGDAPEEVIEEGAFHRATAKKRYENRFACVPLSASLRPSQITPKPRVYGPQTATVTGPSSDEIYTDEHGRIKVQFHWDRLNPADDTSSCWVRVAQHLAGGGWGGMMLPRIGMEVVIEFLEGNPDRPLVTGCVYNGKNTVPYPLPDGRTKSTIKSISTPGGDVSKFNEIRFECAAGSEEIFVHAEKDYNTVVKNNQSLSVGASRSKSVGGNESNTISKDRTTTIEQSDTLTVKKDQTIKIEGNQSITIDGGGTKPPAGALKITGDYNVDVSNSIELIVGSTKIKMTPSEITGTASTKIELQCGGSKITMEPSGIKMTAPAQIGITSGGSGVAIKPGELTANSGTGQLTLHPTHFKLDSAGASIDGVATLLNITSDILNLKGSMSTTVDGGTLTTIQGQTTILSGTAPASITLMAETTIAGAKIKLN